MRLARVEHEESVYLARLDGDAAWLLEPESDHPGRDALLEALDRHDRLERGREVDPATLTLLAPVRRPSKVIGIGLNYLDHAREAGVEPPPAPLVFLKATTSVIGPGEEIRWHPALSSQVDYEAELAVVVGREAKDVGEDALDYVLGYTCCNDVSARDVQLGDGQWARGKSPDTFCPLGPWIVTADEIPDPQQLRLGCDVSGERLQDGTTADMVFSVAEIISYLSRVMTLLPGDVIATGTPDGVGMGRNPPRYLVDGDDVSVWIEGVGSLTNRCVVG